MKNKHKYFNQLFFTYFTAFLLFLTLVFSVGLGFIYREQYSRNVEIHRQLINQIQSQLDSSLESMDRIINGLLFNRSFMDIMANSHDSTASPKYANEVVNYFLTLDAPNLSTYRIISFNDSVYYTLTKSDENPDLIQNAISEYAWEDTVKKASGERVILPVHTDVFSDQGALVYSVAREITNGKNSYGIIEVQNEYDIIDSICTMDNVSGEILLFDFEGNTLYPDASAESKDHPDSFYENIYKTVSEKQENTGSFIQNGAQLSYHISPYSHWTVVLYCPVTALVPLGLQTILFSLLIFLFFTGIVLILFRRLTKRMVAPLNDLNSALSNVSLDNLSLELSKRYNIEEIENINQSFQKMFGHLKNAINISIQSRANEERANYLALQSQMNPHTIYNTITMIEGVTYMNEDFEASELCIHFSKMLRYISDYTKDTYTIEDEVSHLKNYAVLMQKRYEGRLNIHIQTEEALLKENLPKFTLQPLAENALAHGLRSSNSHFEIKAIISGTKNNWKILITDNGSGFTEESLSSIARQLEGCDRSLQNQKDIVNRKIGNLAISNIYMRCRILYGKQFHFSYGNNPDAPGAYVQIEVNDLSES